MMKNKNALILALLGVLILITLLISLLLPKTAPVVQKDVRELELEFTPTSRMPDRHVHEPGHFSLLSSARAESAETAPAPTATPIPEDQVMAYLLITVGDTTYSPYPLRQEGNLTIRQQDGEKVNVVHVTPDSVTMASSTCDNQLCVGEGTVTLENKENRILGGYIICLPNGVTLELYSRHEMLDLLSSQNAR